MSVTQAPLFRSRRHQRVSHEEVLSRSFSNNGNALIVNDYRAMPVYETAVQMPVVDASTSAEFDVQLHNVINIYIKPGATAPGTTTLVIECETQLGDFVEVDSLVLADMKEGRVHTANRRVRITTQGATAGCDGLLFVGGE
jgi:hypothetical protein